MREGEDVAPPGYDVIVVGSGAGGGPLAARLARAGKRVLLLEAGSDVGAKLEYQVPAMHALSTEDPAMAWWFFVGHHRDRALDQEDTKHTPDGILYPRGSALGGSTAVNAMVTVLAPPSDWNRLAEITGDGSFRAREMEKYYDRVREWLDVELADPALAASDPVVSSYLMSAAAVVSEDERVPGLPLDDLASVLARDMNETLRSAETTGFFRLPLATRDGRRTGTRERLLETVAEGYPLEIRAGALVTRVLFEDAPGMATPRAIGVEYVRGHEIYGASILPRRDDTGTVEQAHAREEVVLSAGAFNSPQLLMLSGVGDPDHLAAHGISTRVVAPGVGQNLQDRYEVSVVSELDEPLQILAPCTLGDDTAASDPCLDDWERGLGVYRTNGFLATILTRSSDALAQADLQVFAAPGDARGYFPGYAREAVAQRDRFSWLVLKAHTKNDDGAVRLRDASPFSPPEITFNSYDEGAPLADPDLAAIVEGVNLIRRIEREMGDRPEGEGLREVWPGPDVRSDRDIAEWARRESWGHHASCTNKMGVPDDPMAVVDSRFRVLGTEGLRVVDASVFPEIPGTFIALPIFMLSERAADVILEDHP